MRVGSGGVRRTALPRHVGRPAKEPGVPRYGSCLWAHNRHLPLNRERTGARATVGYVEYSQGTVQQRIDRPLREQWLTISQRLPMRPVREQSHVVDVHYAAVGTGPSVVRRLEPVRLVGQLL